MISDKTAIPAVRYGVRLHYWLQLKHTRRSESIL